MFQVSSMGNNQDLENMGLEEAGEKKSDSDIVTADSFKNHDFGREGMKKIEGKVLSLDGEGEEELTEEQMRDLISEDEQKRLEELVETGSVEEMLIGLDQIMSAKFPGLIKNMGENPADLVGADGNLTEKGKKICEYCRDADKWEKDFKPKDWLALIFADMRYAESRVEQGNLKNMVDEGNSENYWEVYDRKNFRNLKKEAIGLFDGKYKSELGDLIKEEKVMILFLPSLNGLQENQWEMLDDYVHTLQQLKYKSIPEGMNKDEMEEQIKEHIDNIGRIKGEEDLWEKWEKYDEMEGEGE